MGASAAKLTQPERSELSTQRLIEAALSIAAKEGVSAVTFEAIGKRAGYSRGLATQKFGSKKGLVAAVINHLHELRGESFSELHPRGLSGLKGLIAYVEMHLAAIHGDPEGAAYFLLLAGAVAERADTRELFAASHERAKQAMMRFMALGERDGSIRPLPDREASALAVGSLIVGIAIQSHADPAMPFERVAAEARRGIENAFAAERQC